MTSRQRIWLYPEYDENGDLNLTGNLNVPNDFTVEGDVTVTGDLAVTGVTTGVVLDGFTRYAEVAISNAEIKALRASPKTLVAAPGAGKYLEFVSMTLFHDYGSNVLTESTDNMAVKYT